MLWDAQANKKLPLPSLSEPIPPSFVSYTLIPHAAAHSGRVSAKDAVLSDKKVVLRTRLFWQDQQVFVELCRETVNADALIIRCCRAFFLWKTIVLP